MPPTRPPYPPAFRADAVRLVRTSGKTLKETAADLVVSTDSLCKWVRQADIDADRRNGLTTAEREDLQPLRREVRIAPRVWAQLRMAHGIDCSQVGGRRPAHLPGLQPQPGG